MLPGLYAELNPVLLFRTTQGLMIRQMFCLIAGCCLLLLTACYKSDQQSQPAIRSSSFESEADLDIHLQAAATAALGEREGAILVMDAQSGRLRAVVNPRLAYEQAFPPGSAIKPFTALAALRAGVLSRDTRRQCGGQYARDGFAITCSHPQSNTPFNFAQALAYSCNDYFAHVGERLSEGAFNATLASFGFGKRTEVNAGNESAGKLPHDEWSVRQALGEGEQLLVTPVQLLTAYVALLNGGHLYRPRADKVEGFAASEIRRIAIAPAHRELLLNGMRGTVEYGTAAKADLPSLPGYVCGKTGTSTASNGFRTNGWFVGFAADTNAVPAPQQMRLAVLVFLKRAHGAEAAELTRSILAEFIAGASVQNHPSARFVSDDSSDNPALHQTTIKVHLVSANKTAMLWLEDYLRGVLAAEASVEDEAEALKAQAVASRTFALRNVGRHLKDGYDFCSTTHCQRFITDIAAGRNQKHLSRVRQAINDTSGEVMRDERGRLIDAYFHAACGGMTANVESLWGFAPQSYLRGVRDDYCAAMPHRYWTQAIPATQLAKALRSDPQSDVGGRLDEIIVSKRDASGRAEEITLKGARRRTLRGWDFKLIVGRALGWQQIKSSRFEVTRAGANFIFHGSGFGHGLGLCQEGAHVMARRGLSYQQILTHYFPGTVVQRHDEMGAEEGKKGKGEEKENKEGDRVSRLPVSFVLPGSAVLSFRSLMLQLQSAHRFFTSLSRGALSSAVQRRVRTSEHFRAIVSGSNDEAAITDVLRTLEAARADMERRLRSASLALPNGQKTEVIVYATTGDFTGATGQPAWAAAVTLGRTIHLQPLKTLQKRGVHHTTLRHEFAHVVIEALSGGQVPRWLAEGLAIHFAGEGSLYVRVPDAPGLTRDELERRLVQPVSAQEMRSLYAAAWRHVSALVRRKGEPEIWQRVSKRQHQDW